MGGAVLGAGGWVGPEVTAARPSRAGHPDLNFLLVLEGAQAAFNDAALGQGGCAPSGPERPWRSELSAQALRATALAG